MGEDFAVGIPGTTDSRDGVGGNGRPPPPPLLLCVWLCVAVEEGTGGRMSCEARDALRAASAGVALAVAACGTSAAMDAGLARALEAGCCILALRTSAGSCSLCVWRGRGGGGGGGGRKTGGRREMSEVWQGWKAARGAS